MSRKKNLSLSKRDKRMEAAKISKRRKPATSPSAIKSPPLKQRKEESEMEELQVMMRSMMKELKEDREDRKKEIKKEREERKEEMKKLEGMLAANRESWEKEKKQINERQEKLEERLMRLEKADKRKNIIMSNFKAADGDSRKLAEDIEKMLSEKVGERVRVESAYRFKTVLGERQVVKMKDFEDKLIVMRNKKKLYEESRGEKTPFYVDDDLTQEDREIQKKAREFAKVSRAAGREARVGYRKVFEDGVEMRWSNDKKEFVKGGRRN